MICMNRLANKQRDESLKKYARGNKREFDTAAAVAVHKAKELTTHANENVTLAATTARPQSISTIPAA